MSQTGAVAEQATAALHRVGPAQVAKTGAAQQLPEQPTTVQLQPSEKLPAGVPAQSSDSQPMGAPDALGSELKKMQKTGQQRQGATASQVTDAAGVDSAAHGPESQVAGKHAASTAKPMSNAHSVSGEAMSSSRPNTELQDQQSSLAQSLKVKKRKKGEHRPSESRLPIQQPKGIPALKGPSRLQSGRGLNSKSSGVEQEGHSRSHTGKRHRSSSAETGTEGSFQSQTGQAPEGRASRADVKGNRLPHSQAGGSEKV